MNKKAYMKSFHDTYIAKTVTVKIPGIARGIRTVKRILKSLDPSKIATSLKDLGILVKAFLIIKIPKGTIDMECRKINAIYVSSRLKFLSNMYIGIIREIPGIRIGKRRKIKKDSLNF